MSKPQISIIVGVLNGSRTITQCIDSLLSLSKDSPSHEIIVVDNGSTDETQAILKRYPQLIVEKEQIRGVSAARNKGLTVAQGEYAAFTDADCYCTPNWLIEGIKFFHDPAVGIVGGKIEGGATNNLLQEWMNQHRVLDQEWVLKNQFMPYVQTANAFFKISDILDVGGFDVNLLSGQDADLCWNIQSKTGKKVVFASQAVVYHNHRDSVEEFFRVSASRAEAGLFLAQKWKNHPQRTFKTSLWEIGQIVKYGFIYFLSVLKRDDHKKSEFAKYDFISRLARKWGLIRWRFKYWFSDAPKK
jgi:glycosyltransferase involved in cell wall biosynthesis